MDERFTRLDMARLTQAVGIASSPFDYPAFDDWRGAVVQSCMAFLDGHMAHFDVFGAGLTSPHFFVGYPDGLFEDWSETWSSADTALVATEQHNLTVYSRRYRYRVAGAQWTAKYKRSPIYNEFYRKYGLGDAASIFFRRRDLKAHLLVETDTVASDAMDERGRTFLSVLQPALQSAILSLVGVNGGYWDTEALLNALHEPIAIVGADGQWIHRSSAFDLALDMLPEGSREAFLEATRHRAQALLRTLATPSSSTAGDTLRATRFAPLWTHDLFDVSATTIVLSGKGDRNCLIKLSIRSGATLGQAAAAGLSKRECGVAMLLVDGMSNKAIALRLGISEHTARRHTESILRKLGISSRSGVASALRGNAGVPPLDRP